MSIVRSQRNEKYCINISEHYCSHWEDLHAFREAIQNWMDAWKHKYPNHVYSVAFEENRVLKITHFYLLIDGVKNLQNYIKYDEEEKTLEMVNEGSFKVESMLMGASSKKNNNQALGQFGQGMKLFFMILLKKSHRLFIESGGFVYAPSLDQWQYQSYDSKVLHVNIKPRVFSDNTVLVIKNVSKAKFDELRYISLMLVNDYQVIEYPGMRLIISNNPLLNKGKIFKKGVLVSMRYHLDSIYSYDFEAIVLGRDRDSINDPIQLKNLCSQLYVKILDDYENLQLRPQIIDELPKILKEVVALIKRCSIDVYHMHYTITPSAANRIYREYLKEKNVAESYPVNSSADQTLINQTRLKYGLPASFYPTEFLSCHFTANLKKSTRYYKTITQKVQEEILNRNRRQMNDGQRNMLAPVKNAIAALLPEINSLAFKVQEIEGIACYQDGSNVYVNIKQMRDIQLFKRKLLKLLVKDV